MTSENMFRNWRMAIAYRDTVNTLGPCPQLIAFLNQYGFVDERAGVAIESFSESTQRELTAAALDPAKHCEIATESLKGLLSTLGVTAFWGGMLGGVAATAIGGENPKLFLKIGGFSLAALVGGWISLTVSEKMKDEPVELKYSAFVSAQHAFDEDLKEDQEAVRKLPKNFDLSAWREYDKFCDQQFDRVRGRRVKMDFERIPFGKSGWTVENFHSSVKWLEERGIEVEKVRESCRKDVERIEHYLTNNVRTSQNQHDLVTTEIVRLIYNSASSMDQLFHYTQSALTWMKEVLSDVSKHFEEKK